MLGMLTCLGSIVHVDRQDKGVQADAASAVPRPIHDSHAYNPKLAAKHTCLAWQAGSLQGLLAGSPVHSRQRSPVRRHTY